MHRFAVLFVFAACGKSQVAPCPTKYKDVPADQQKGDLTCSCGSDASGTVWGNGIYTTDSSICVAAQHAGAMPASGGTVTVKKAAGCPSYSGGAANGVTTAPWGSYDASFYFPAKGDGKCAVSTTCPTTFDQVPADSAEVTCTCPAGSDGGGSVWGVGIYTSDSSICRAGVHAGAIPASGGSVTIKRAAGCEKYGGSDANGVKTQSWGSHAGSFFFAGKGDGKCS